MGGISLVLALAGCGGSGDESAPGLPTPARGKVATFDLGKLSKKYDLRTSLQPGAGVEASDAAGNVYMTIGGPGKLDVVRMSPKGVVSRYTQATFASRPNAMTVTAGGALAFATYDGSDSAIRWVHKDGSVTSLNLGPHNAFLIGSRPDGSVVFVEGNDLLSAKDGGTAVRVYHHSSALGPVGVAASDGTVYVRAGGPELSHLLVVPPGGTSHSLTLTGNLPGSRTPISTLGLLAVAPATDGGFYATADDASDTTAYVLHVSGTHATVLARTGVNNHGCVPGKQYPALSNTCAMQSYIAQSGNRVLAFGSPTPEGDGPAVDPALVLNATAGPQS